MHDVLIELENAITAINGPYKEMYKALYKVGEARGAIVEDEVLGSCEACEEVIFVSEMDVCANVEEGGWICKSCFDKSNTSQMTTKGRVPNYKQKPADRWASGQVVR